MAIIKGGTSGVVLDTGPTSKAALVEMADSAAKLYGASKVMCCWNGLAFTSASTEALISLTPVRDGVAGAPATTFAVTAGKRLVLIGMSVFMKNAGAAVQFLRCTLRMNPGGACVAASPVIAMVGAGSNSAVAQNTSGGMSIVLSPGYPCLMEFSGAQQIGVAQLSQGATAGNDFTLWGYEY